ncbi:hypothetical protein [Actinomycetospora flava]|uniref:Uncharacterized protein n=1 Tax=Actinomycetospora flava TaxID=3129232 RepID=A0ABU8M107_9PSEU
MGEPAAGHGCPLDADRLARALDAASAHPTGTPNRTQLNLADRMRAWLDATPCTEEGHAHPMQRGAS